MDGDYNMKKIKNIILLLVCLFLVQAVYSAGVASPYSENIPLVMAPGQVHEFYLGLQNMVGNEDLKSIVKVSSGNEFLEITDTNNEYLVPFGSKDIKINLKVTVPEDIKEGDYTLGVEVKFIPINEGKNGGMVELNQGIATNIPLQIKEGALQPKPQVTETTETSTSVFSKQKAKSNSLLIFAFVVVIIIVLLVFLFRRKK